MMIHRRSDVHHFNTTANVAYTKRIATAHNKALSHHTFASLSGVRVNAAERWCGRESARVLPSAVENY